MPDTVAATTCAMASHARRAGYGKARGVWWWHAIMPHRRPPITSDRLIDARTPMFAMYSRWIGDTLRKTEKLMSSARGSGDGPLSTRTGW